MAKISVMLEFSVKSSPIHAYSYKSSFQSILADSKWDKGDCFAHFPN